MKLKLLHHRQPSLLLGMLTWALLLPLAQMAQAQWSCPANEPANCNAGNWGMVHAQEHQVDLDRVEQTTISGSIENCWNLHGAAQQHANAAIGNQSGASARATSFTNQAQSLSDLSLKQTTFFATVDFMRQSLEQTLPRLIVTIEDSVMKQRTTLAQAKASMEKSLARSRDPKQMADLKFQLAILQELDSVGSATGDAPVVGGAISLAPTTSRLPHLLRALDTGTDAEKLSAMALFSPLTQSILRMALADTHSSLSGAGAFQELRTEMVQVQTWMSEQAANLRAQLSSAQSDLAAYQTESTLAQQALTAKMAECRSLEERRNGIPAEIVRLQNDDGRISGYLNNQGCLHDLCRDIYVSDKGTKGGRGA